MSSKPDSKPGEFHLLTWPASASRETHPLGEGTRLLVAPAELSDRAGEFARDAAPIVFLPPDEPKAIELAVGLARRTTADGGTVVWLRSADSSMPPGAAADAANWFREREIECRLPDDAVERRPLAGRCILLPRPRRQVSQTVDHLASLGATVVSQPAIIIRPPADIAGLDAAIDRLGQFDWLVFSSANGVHFFFTRLWDRQGDLRRLAGVKLAAIGPGTAEALAEHRLRADLVPEQHRAEALAEALSAEALGKRLLLVRASRGREVLAERLAAAGAQVEQVVAYESIDANPTEPQLSLVTRMLAEGQIDWVIVTSSAIARSLDRLFGGQLHHAKLASISPITSATLRELGHEPTAEARTYTLDGVAEVIVGR